MFKKINPPTHFEWLTLDELSKLQLLVVQNHPLFSSSTKSIAVNVYENGCFVFAIEGEWCRVSF